MCVTPVNQRLCYVLITTQRVASVSILEKSKNLCIKFMIMAMTKQVSRRLFVRFSVLPDMTCPFPLLRAVWIRGLAAALRPHLLKIAKGAFHC